MIYMNSSKNIAQSMKKFERIPFTKDGYQKVLDEKQKLLLARPEAVRHLSLAQGMGDLSENGYYKASRARLSALDGRLRHLEKLIRFGRIVPTFATDSVQIGTRVIVRDNTGEHTYTIVGGYESDPSKQTISHKSPIGRALLGKRVGDSVEVHAPVGVKRLTITSIVQS